MQLELRNVRRTFDARNGDSIVALDTINLLVRKGEFVCVIGPSGCGKSTLLNLLAGLDSPSAGEVLAGGEPVRGPDPSRVLIFQDAPLFPWLSVQGNVEFGLRMRGMRRAERHAIAGRLLEMVHLTQFAHAYVHELSGGMRQRVAIARALAVEPRVLLLDEPFGALDAMTRSLLHAELQDVFLRTGKTVVFVTHNVREAVVLGDRVLVMSPRPGRIVAEHTIVAPRPRQIEDDATMAMARSISADLARATRNAHA